MSLDNKITRDRLIRKIASATNYSIASVREVVNAMDEAILDYASSVDKENPEITIKIFEGVTLDAKYIPEKTKTNNLTGKTEHVESKIKPKFNVTRTYCQKVNSKR